MEKHVETFCSGLGFDAKYGPPSKNQPTATLRDLVEY